MKANGAAIRVIRERSGLNVTELASRVGISRGFLSNIEAGRKDGSRSPEVLISVARELKCDLAAIIRGPIDDADAA